MNLHKLELSSVDGTKLNLEVLYQIVSSCVTEVKNKKTGELRRLVKENGSNSNVIIEYEKIVAMLRKKGFGLLMEMYVK
jgi:hypothetical protein